LIVSLKKRVKIWQYREILIMRQLSQWPSRVIKQIFSHLNPGKVQAKKATSVGTKNVDVIRRMTKKTQKSVPFANQRKKRNERGVKRIYVFNRKKMSFLSAC